MKKAIYSISMLITLSLLGCNKNNSPSPNPPPASSTQTMTTTEKALVGKWLFEKYETFDKNADTLLGTFDSISDPCFKGGYIIFSSKPAAAPAPDSYFERIIYNTTPFQCFGKESSLPWRVEVIDSQQFINNAGFINTLNANQLIIIAPLDSFKIYYRK